MSTYYVSTSGSDLATGLTELLAFQHIDKAMNVVAAGDKVWVKADGNYTELATIDTVGTNTAPIVFEGYTTTPGDGGRATITGAGARLNCVSDTVAASTPIYYVFKNFRFTASTGEGVSTDAFDTVWKNCRFDNNGTNGCGARQCTFEECAFDSNGDAGVVIGGKNACFVGCTFYSNVGDAIHYTGTDGSAVVVLDCTFFDNGGDAISAIAGGQQLVVVANCTIDGNNKNTTNGIELDGPIQTCVVNTVLYDCGVGALSQNHGDRKISRNNLVNGNTTPYSGFATFTGEVTSAPGFVNEVAGADYHPDTGSPLKAAGFDGGASMDIGAVQSVPGVTANAFQLKIGV